MPALPPLPALVVGRVTHARYRPIRHAFRHRMVMWLVDLDAVPQYAGFRSVDHLGDQRLTIKDNVLQFLKRNGIDLGDRGRLLMLAHGRVLGHVFNPLSVFWCFDSSARLACVVAEVHNTHHEQHAYLLRPDERGSARIDKVFRVSPFFDVSGEYEVRLTLQPERVSTSVALRRNGDLAFVGSFRGRPRRATRRRRAFRYLRHPLMTQRISTLIRVHGIRLWLRGLRRES